MSKRCSDWPSDASFFHGGRWVSIDEETRPIGTSPGISTVSVPPMRSGSTASTTHRAPAAGRRFARREFARQPSLRETQEREGGVLPRVQPLLGVGSFRCEETNEYIGVSSSPALRSTDGRYIRPPTVTYLCVRIPTIPYHPQPSPARLAGYLYDYA